MNENILVWSDTYKYKLQEFEFRSDCTRQLPNQRAWTNVITENEGAMLLKHKNSNEP